MRDITLVLSYYDNPRMLEHQYGMLGRLPRTLRDHIRVIVVDDGSPNEPAVYPVDGDLRSRVTLVRMVEDVRWNQDACRNLGVNLARTPWVLLTDVDHLVPEDTWEDVIDREALFSSDVYQFTRKSIVGRITDNPLQLVGYKFHPNTWLMTRKMFDRAGGYDERFAGWYGTDGDFRDRVSKVAHVIHLPSCVIRVGREIVPDASTTTYDRKTQQDGENIKRIKKERAADPEWRPLRFQFPWTMVPR